MGIEEAPKENIHALLVEYAKLEVEEIGLEGRLVTEGREMEIAKEKEKLLQTLKDAGYLKDANAFSEDIDDIIKKERLDRELPDDLEYQNADKGKTRFGH